MVADTDSLNSFNGVCANEQISICKRPIFPDEHYRGNFTMKKTRMLFATTAIFTLSISGCAIPLPLLDDVYYSNNHRHYHGSNREHRIYDQRRQRSEEHHHDPHSHR